MNQLPETHFGDRSQLTRLLLEGSSAAQLERHGSGTVTQDLRAETCSRHDALKHVRRACAFKTPDHVVEQLKLAAQKLQKALYNDLPSPSPPQSAGFSSLKLQPAGILAPQIPGFIRWLQSAPQTPATQIVADLFLYWQLGSQHHEDTPGTDQQLRMRFGPRIDSQTRFARWIPKEPGERSGQWNCPQHLPFENAPVCVPILLQETRQDQSTLGVIRWLTVELFRDGFTGLIPDLLTLGMTCINLSFSDSDNPAASGSFLQHMDRVWIASGLGAKGYSGRFRLLSRAPLHCSWMYPAETNDDSATPAVSISGNSAQAALMVAVLAASGHVFEPVSSLPDWNGKDFTPPRPVYLNRDYAITAALQLPAEITDSRQIPLDKVSGLPDKLSAIGRFSPLDAHENTGQRLFAMLLQSDQYTAEANNPHSGIVADSVRQERAAETALRQTTRTDNTPPQQFHGVRFRSVSIVQEALDLMLESNQWRHLMMQKKQQSWLAEWSYPRNKHGQFLDKFGNVICDQFNQPVTDENHALLASLSINSGSLEYMQLLNSSSTAPEILKRIAGAAEEQTDQADNSV